MTFSIENRNRVIDILNSYSGSNPFILNLKKNVIVLNKTNALDDFSIEYVLMNAGREAKSLGGRVMYLCDWFAQQKKEEWGTEFIPNRIKVNWLMGETTNMYHIYGQYRQSVPAFSMFIPKKAVLKDFLLEDYHNVEVDFDRYDRLSSAKAPGRVLMEHQKEAIKFLLSRKKCILADDQGLGKTTSLSVAAIEGNFDSILIICPASLKTNWLRELNYYVPERDITIIGGFTDFKKDDFERYLGYGIGKSGKTIPELKEEALARGKWNDNRFVIINFDILNDVYMMPDKKARITEEMARANRPMLDYLKGKKTLIIIDEAHKLSKEEAERYIIIEDMIKEAQPASIYLATGTPITNGNHNFFNLLSLIGADIAKDKDYFFNTYCVMKKTPINNKMKEKRDRIQNAFIASKGKRTWYDLDDKEKKELSDKLDKSGIVWRTYFDGGKNLDELRDKVSHLYLRRLKEQLDGLPPKHFYERFYELNAIQMMEYEKLWDEYIAKREEEYRKELEEYRKYSEALLEYETLKAYDKSIRPPKPPNPDKTLVSGGVYRQYLSEQMVPNTLALCDKCLAKGEKVVIACCYDKELNMIADYYGDKCVIYNGKMSLKEKDMAIKKFQNDPDTMVFVGNIIAAGVGITLTASRVMIFNNISYVPGDNAQMCDRIHRIGQKREVHIFYQLFKDTQYEKMWNTVVRKTSVIEQVIKKEEDK